MTDVEGIAAFHLARWGGSGSWGMCAIVATGIARDLGPDARLVGGELVQMVEVIRDLPPTEMRTSHWWVEWRGQIVDPMGDLLPDLVRREEWPEADMAVGWASGLIEAVRRGHQVANLPPWIGWSS